MIKVLVPVKIIVHWDQLSREEMIISSAIKLGRGGRARLARLAINHQAAIRGKIVFRPRVSNKVRLWVRS